MIRVTCKGKTAELPEGSAYADAAGLFASDYEGEILLALDVEEKRIHELFKEIPGDEELEFLTYRDAEGAGAYLRTACFLLMKAVREELGPGVQAAMEFNLGGNYYISLNGARADAALAAALEARMRACVENAMPVRKTSLPAYDAICLLEKEGEWKKAHAVDYRVNARINFYLLGGFSMYFTSSLCRNASAVRHFALLPFEGGLLLQLPSRERYPELNPVLPAGKHFLAQKAGQEWADRIGISDLTDLNDRITAGKAEDLILTQEAYFEKRLGDIAETVTREKRKFIFLAGPSSSGKTTTAYRLAIQLRAYGSCPEIISADDYFFPAEERPLLPDGTPDMESIRAVDTELFSRDMLKLLAGEEAELPEFNFVLQKREYHGKKIRLRENSVLIVEGIHCLNPVFSEKIPEDKKYRIYVSALNPLSVDSANLISSSDCRLLRRIIRDYRTRGSSAARTIRLWPTVRKGEEENIFPYQEEADVVINSAMIYELSALRTYVEPLLFGIRRAEPEYREARRLLKSLSVVLAVPSVSVPANSVIREFIGGSCIR